MTAPGLTLTQQAPASAIATVTLGEAPITAASTDLLGQQPVQTALIRAIRDTGEGTTQADYFERLDDADVPSPFISRCIGVCRGGRRDATQALVYARWAGHGWSTTEDILHSYPRVFALSDGVTPTIAVRIPREFRDQRADQRRDICRWLAELAGGCDLRVVASPLMQRWLADAHRQQLPGGVSDQCNTTTSESPPLSDALSRLDPTGRPVTVLQQLADEPSETLSYHALYSTFQVSKSRVRQAISTLVNLGLVATFDGSDGKHVELLGAGQGYLDQIEDRMGLQATLSESVSATGQPVHDSRDIPPAHEGSPQGEGRPGWRGSGPAEVRDLPRWQGEAVAAAAPEGGIGLIDHPVPRVDDPREGSLGFDPDDERLTVSVEVTRSALQYWVSTARALASRRTWDLALPESRLESVDDPGPLILRHARNIGGLPSDGLDDYEGLRSNILEWRERLEDLTRKYSEGDYEDRDRFRAEILRCAHGLAGTMVHLLDVADVDVVREARLPDFREFTEEQRRDLARTLAVGVAIQSRYGHYGVYRQLFEHRDDRREMALAPRIDADDPEGELIGQFVLSGPAVSEFASKLRGALMSPAPLHEQAPEIEVAVPIREQQRRSTYSRVVQGVLATKNLGITRDAVSLLKALAGSPLDVARALGRGLAPESEYPGRDVRLDEVRTALSNGLDPERVLPDASSTVSKAVHALAGAAGPLSQSELADAAGVSSRSLRRYREVLEALDLLQVEAEGWRLTLPRRDEYSDVAPWYLDADAGVDTRLHSVVGEVVEELADTPGEFVDLTMPLGFADGPPDYGPLLERWPWFEPWLAVLQGMLGPHPGGEPEARTVSFGQVHRQASVKRATEPSPA